MIGNDGTSIGLTHCPALRELVDIEKLQNFHFAACFPIEIPTQVLGYPKSKSPMKYTRAN